MYQDTLHLRAPGNWINDPNGFIFYRGLYHLFYQHFPYAPRWGTMHWGHAVSPDLVHWTHLGVALFPTKGYDQNGVFSGTAVEVDGQLRLYYSAVRYLARDDDDIHVPLDGNFVTSQALVTSEDGMHFDNWAKTQVLPVLTDPAVGDAKDTRDPKVWRSGGSFYMLLGSTTPERQGRALFFRSENGRDWTFVNQFTAPDFGTMLECPDLFALEGTHLFLGSPMGVNPEPGYPDLAKYAPADFDQETCTLRLRTPLRLLDWGLDLYAPQTTLDAAGRRVLVGWMRMARPVTHAADERGPWIGQMCLPRVVEVRDGEIVFSPHPNVVAQFTQPVEHPAPDRPLRVLATLRPGESLNLFGYHLAWTDGKLTADRSAVLDGAASCPTAETPPISGDVCPLEIYVDQNLVEVFVNQGQYVLTHVVYQLQPTLSGPIDAVYAMAAPEEP